jgi:AcrR family transcriptional regulator
MPRRARRGAYHHGNLREALVSTAEAMLPKTGVRELSLREVARRAGVSNMAPYRHFPNKEALLAALAERGFARLAAGGEAAKKRHPQSRRNQLIDYGVSYVELVRTSPELADLMFGRVIPDVSAYPALDAQSRATFASLGGILDKDLKSTLVAWAFIHGLGALVAAGRLPLPDKSIGYETLVRTLCRQFVDSLPL